MLAQNPETGEVSYQVVEKTFVREVDQIVHVVAGGTLIETTDEHPFFVEGEGFVGAGRLKTGDVLRLADGENAKVEKLWIEALDEKVPVYNFEVAEYHTYYVSEMGVLVHNMCAVTGGETKFVPSPNGKKGGVAHQKVIERIKINAEKRGLKYRVEYKYNTVGGYKNSRYADVVVFDSKGRVMEVHQVGRTTKKYGAPISRERKAIHDIRSSGDYNGAKIIYHPYDR